ncbi:MAG: uracil-DNA glycosylase [Thermosulfidibacteraceae bacterium]|jgi:DNA polymerase
MERDIKKQLLALLEWYKEAGITFYFKNVEIPRTSIDKADKKDKVKQKEDKVESKEELLEKIRNEALSCKKCELYKTRKNLVFGEGNPNAKIMFIGEAPGREEDEQGRPFVGQAGQHLTKLIEFIGLKREEVYIANVLKCRPPNNRNPLPQEIEACKDFLFRQISIINPKIICTLGTFSTQLLLLNNRIQITRVRGNLLKGWKNYMVFPTFHPSYLLRNPGSKKTAIEDFKKIKEILEELD